MLFFLFSFNMALSYTDCQALTLAVMTEAGSLTKEEKDVILFTLINRQKIYEESGHYAPIQDYIWQHTSMQGFSTIQNAFHWYAGHDKNSPFYPDGHPNFKQSFRHVMNFMQSPYEDWTHGTIQFKHAESKAGAEWLGCYYNQWDTQEIKEIIAQVATPIINGDTYRVGVVGVTVYTNANITPRLPENAKDIICEL